MCMAGIFASVKLTYPVFVCSLSAEKDREGQHCVVIKCHIYVIY